MKAINTLLTAAMVAICFTCFAGSNPMTGTYTIGNNSGSNFQTVSTALTAVRSNGANGPITFIVDKNIYSQKEIIAAIVTTPVSTNVEFISSDEQANVASVSDDAEALATK